MQEASEAIAEGRGFQLIADMMGEFRRSGLTEKEAVHEMVAILDAYQKEEEQNALILIKHLREWMDRRLCWTIGLLKTTTQRILCVDDNAQMLSVLQIGLEKAGFEVLTASHGTEALRLYHLHAQELSAIISDNEMPHMSGLEFIQSVRKIGFEGRVVIMSGNFKPNELLAFAPFRITGFFHKPFNVGLLAAMLSKPSGV